MELQGSLAVHVDLQFTARTQATQEYSEGPPSEPYWNVFFKPQCLSVESDQDVAHVLQALRVDYSFRQNQRLLSRRKAPIIFRFHVAIFARFAEVMLEIEGESVGGVKNMRCFKTDLLVDAEDGGVEL